MHRLRNTFTRSRTPTGAEMKTQSSLEVPKQVRSASFDEIQLEAQRANQFLKVNQQASADEASSGPLLQVPQASGQRSRSFDLTGAVEDSQAAVAAAFLDVPKRFQRRKSSSKTPPPCIHCLYLEEYRRHTGVEQRQYYDSGEYQAFSYTSSSSSSSGDEADEEEEDDNEVEEEDDDDEDYGFSCNVTCNVLLPPPIVSPCGITFTLSPTNGDDPEEDFGGLAAPPEVDCTGPVLPPPPGFDTNYTLPLGSPPPIAVLPLGSPPPIAPFSSIFSPSPTIEVPPSSPAVDTTNTTFCVGPTRARRRSISRQEAIFVEPTGASLENVSSTEHPLDIPVIAPPHDDDDTSSKPISSDDNEDKQQPPEATTAAAQHNDNHSATADFVRDIYLQVPDLKRDRAASVDSCFTKVTNAKTEELKPPEGELTLLAVPGSGAIRSRSVDIVLPTEEQARYKALALAGTAPTGAVSHGTRG